MRMAWTDQRSFDVAFEANDAASFRAAGRAALDEAHRKSPRSVLWCIVTERGGRYLSNPNVFYQPAYRQDRPGMVLRGYGNAFQPVTEDAVSWGQSWSHLVKTALAFGLYDGPPPVGDGAASEIVADAGRKLTPDQERLNALYNDLVYVARNQRRQIEFRSPRLPEDRAASEESERADEMTRLGRRYASAAIAYRPETDWAEWEVYVRSKLHPEIADMVVDAVVSAVAICPRQEN